MIKKIKIRKFKTFENEEIEFSEGLNVIIGPNGSGKTNLIDAIREGLANSNKEIEVLSDDDKSPILLDNPKKLPKGKQLIVIADNNKFIVKADKIIGISFEKGKSRVTSLMGKK